MRRSVGCIIDESLSDCSVVAGWTPVADKVVEVPDDPCVILAGRVFWAKAGDWETWRPFIEYGDAVGRDGRVFLSAADWSAEAVGSFSRSGNDLWQKEAGPLPTGVEAVTVRVAELEVQETGAGTISVPVRTGEVIRTVRLGQWPVRLIRTEVRANGRLRIHVDLGTEGETFLRRFDRLQVNGRPVSWSSRHDEASGQIRWLEFTPPAGAGSVTLTLAEPVVVVRGPWAMAVPVNR